MLFRSAFNSPPDEQASCSSLPGETNGLRLPPAAESEEAGEGEGQQAGGGGLGHHGHAQDSAAGGAGIESGVGLVGVAELDPVGDVRRKQAVVHAVVTKRAVGVDDVEALGGGGEKGGDVEVQAIHIEASQIGGGIDREKAGTERSIVEKNAE